MVNPMTRLEILGATYGTKLVTETVERLVKDDALDVYADDATFGEAPPYGTRKTLVIAYRYGGQDARLLVTKEGDEAILAFEANPLWILGAAYGPGDVTDQVRDRVRDNALRVRAENDVFGDPWPRVVKTLAIVYRYGSQAPRTLVVKEKEEASIAPPSGQAGARDDGELSILGAAYGPADVTGIVSSLIRRNALRVRADNATFGDAWPEHPKSLVVVYRYRGLDPRTLTLKEGEEGAIVPPHGPSLRVLGAAYGPADVTEKVRSLVRGGGLQVSADNATFGDSWHGVPKTLTLVYSRDGSPPNAVAVPEGKTITIRGE